MPVQLLISATEHRKELKGQIIGIKDEPATWGGMQVMPGYVIARVTGATKAQVVQFLEVKAKTVFDYSVVTEGGFHIVTVSVAVPIVNLGGGFKADAKRLLEDDWGAFFLSWTPPVGPAVFRVLDIIPLPEMKGDVLDKFQEYLGPRYRFSSSDVDTAIANGGTIQLTKAQALNRIVDRLA